MHLIDKAHWGQYRKTNVPFSVEKQAWKLYWYHFHRRSKPVNTRERELYDYCAYHQVMDRFINKRSKQK